MQGICLCEGEVDSDMILEALPAVEHDLQGLFAYKRQPQCKKNPTMSCVTKTMNLITPYLTWHYVNLTFFVAA